MNEATVITEVVRQVPALAVLTWIVYKFLAHLRAGDEASAKRDADRTAAIEHLGETCHAFQKELSSRVQTSLDRNTETLGRAARDLERAEKQ